MYISTGSFLKNISLFLLLSCPIMAINELTMRVPDVYLMRTGYIDKAVLVIEPHGSYSEQSLYLEYSDHGQFDVNNKVEVIHRFELPQGAVIDDMWLWIGDSVMKARMFDTWKARAIYDSIVSMKRDPAFLSKVGDQYELHIYPLTPGSIRKVKINYIVPSKWINNLATTEIPIRMLAASGNQQQPLDILYRYRDNIWGEPAFLEDIPALFTQLQDTMDFHYKSTRIQNIHNYRSLNFVYQTNFQDAFYFDSFSKTEQPTYFEIGIVPAAFFDLKPDSTSKNVIVGIDLSGSTNKNLDQIIPVFKKVLYSALKSQDKVKFIISGAGKTKIISSDFISGSIENTNMILDEFKNSTFADSISKSKLPYLVYCDNQASQCWGFSNISALAKNTIYSDLESAVPEFSKANIIAAYDHGFHKLISVDNFNNYVKPALDSFFLKGGRFLSYFDYNREYYELIGHHYIQGLTTKTNVHDAVTLYRNMEGNIGSYFPEQITHAGTYFLSYTDPDVKVELMDKDGNPAVISKRIGRGIIVISGIWSFNDDNGLRQILGVPLLGLNSFGKARQQLLQLLDVIRLNAGDNLDKCLIFSNADSLILENSASQWIDDYLGTFTIKKPIYNSVNLIDGQEGLPPYLTVNLTKYYGSGFLLNKLAEKSGGIHYALNNDDWNYISSSLSTYALPKRDSLKITLSVNDGSGTVEEIREVNPVVNDLNKPLFYIGSTTAAHKYNFNISAKYNGYDDWKSKDMEVLVNEDSTRMGNIIPVILGNEKLKDMFRYNSTDTIGIVRLAMKYNILCDFTSLIALEPNDTMHFMEDPFDEGNMTGADNEITFSDSLYIDVYPNPFNMQTNISVNISAPSVVELVIYNILGQQVGILSNSELITGRKTYRWNGKDEFNQDVSTGIYIARAIVKEKASGSTNVITKKLLLLK